MGFCIKQAQLHDKVMAYFPSERLTIYGALIESPEGGPAMAFQRDGSLQYIDISPDSVISAEQRDYGFHGRVLYLELPMLCAWPIKDESISALLRSYAPRIRM